MQRTLHCYCETFRIHSSDKTMLVVETIIWILNFDLFLGLIQSKYYLQMLAHNDKLQLSIDVIKRETSTALQYTVWISYDTW